MKHKMKQSCGVYLVLLVLAAAAGAVRAGALSGAGTSDTLIEQESLSFLTIGADYQYQQRDISAGGDKTRLKSQTVDAFVGVDPWDWLMIFATAGGSAAKVGDEDSFNDPKFKWSLGFDLNFWEYNLEEPEFMAGRLGLKTQAEFSMYNTGNDAEEAKWNEYFLALLVNYRVLSVNARKSGNYPHSLVLFAGPALSWLDGHYNSRSGAGAESRTDFNEKTLFGVVGGAELFIAANLSVGAAVQYYDAATVNVNAKYHF